MKKLNALLIMQEQKDYHPSLWGRILWHLGFIHYQLGGNQW